MWKSILEFGKSTVYEGVVQIIMHGYIYIFVSNTTLGTIFYGFLHRLKITQDKVYRMYSGLEN